MTAALHIVEAFMLALGMLLLGASAGIEKGLRGEWTQDRSDKLAKQAGIYLLLAICLLVIGALL